jgi:hypothetical protein
MTFGIPVKNFPVTTSGQQKFEHTLQCIEERRQLELTTRKAAFAAALQGEGGTRIRIFAPTPNDVLCGRGKPFQEHTGNIDLGGTIEDYNTQYKATKRGSKADICQEIVQRFQSKGARFLKRLDTTGEWEEVSNDEAREKVSQGFRNMFKKHVASTSTTSSTTHDNASATSADESLVSLSKRTSAYFQYNNTSHSSSKI